jgi:hypothetical protein
MHGTKSGNAVQFVCGHLGLSRWSLSIVPVRASGVGGPQSSTVIVAPFAPSRHEAPNAPLRVELPADLKTKRWNSHRACQSLQRIPCSNRQQKPDRTDFHCRCVAWRRSVRLGAFRISNVASQEALSDENEMWSLHNCYI